MDTVTGTVPDYATRPYMRRWDGVTRKNTTGFYGQLKTADGSMMTEFSQGTPGDERDPYGPSVAPGLTQEHLDYLTKVDPRFQRTARPDLYREITDNASHFIRQRVASGQDPFFEVGKDLQATPLTREQFDNAARLREAFTPRPAAPVNAGDALSQRDRSEIQKRVTRWAGSADKAVKEGGLGGLVGKVPIVGPYAQQVVDNVQDDYALIATASGYGGRDSYNRTMKYMARKADTAEASARSRATDAAGVSVPSLLTSDQDKLSGRFGIAVDVFNGASGALQSILLRRMHADATGSPFRFPLANVALNVAGSATAVGGRFTDKFAVTRSLPTSIRGGLDRVATAGLNVAGNYMQDQPTEDRQYYWGISKGLRKNYDKWGREEAKWRPPVYK